LSRAIRNRPSRRGAEREAQPRRRGTIATFLRFEYRDVQPTDSPDASSWRFRGRLELAYPLNRPKLTQNGAVYLTSDAELFVPLSDGAQQGQINQWRLRNGLGFRIHFNTRLETLYVWTTKKDNDTGRFATDSQAIDIRMKLAF